MLLVSAIFRAAMSLRLPPHMPLGFPSSAASSANGKGAICVTDNYPVTINSTSMEISLAESASQSVVTELIQEL